MKTYRLIYDVERTLGGVTKKERSSMVVKAATAKEAEKYVNKRYAKNIRVILVNK